MDVPVVEMVKEAATYLIGAGSLGGVVALARWAFKVERSFSEQSVVNAKQVAALDGILTRLDGHETLDEANHNALDRRIALIERRF